MSTVVNHSETQSQELEKKFHRRGQLEAETLGVRVRVMVSILLLGGFVALIWSFVDFFVVDRPETALVEFIIFFIAMLLAFGQRWVENKDRVLFAFSFLSTALLLVLNYTYIVSPSEGIGTSNTFWLFLNLPMVYFLAGRNFGVAVTLIFSIWIYIFHYLSLSYGVGRPVTFEYVSDLLSAFWVISIFLYLYDLSKEKFYAKLVSLLQQDRTVLNTISDGIVAINTNTEIVVFSRAAEQIFERKQEDVLGQRLVKALPFGNAPMLNFSITEPQNWSSIEIETEQGSRKTLDIKVAPIEVIVSDKEENRGLMFTVHDTTSEKELEKMHVDFVALAAHELRTPLTSLKGNLAVLEEEVMSQVTDEHKIFIKRSLASVQRLSALMENLLSISKIEEGDLSIRRNKINWVELIDEKFVEYQPIAKRTGLKIEWKHPDKPLPGVFVDKDRIAEVLNNLLNNAMLYTKTGTITIKCEYYLPDNKVVTHIEDTGEGIPTKNLPYIFSKFYRVEDVVEEESQGAGLGLYISKAIVELLGGEIWVESKLGKGSVFSFSLPAEAGVEVV